MTASATFELRDVVAGPAGSPILRGSTLLRLLNRLDDPRSGSIRLDGRPVDELDPRELRRRVAMVFQQPPRFAGTVFDNLRVAAPDLDDAGARAALDRVGLPHELLDRDAADLSGGEAQRMAFARALLTGPALVLADEPTASLDGDSRAVVEALARSIAADGVAIVWVTHDTEQLRRLADHVMVLVDGRVVAFGHLPELDVHDDAEIRRLVGRH